MDLENQLFGSAMTWGTDYFGIADLTPARDTILEQGGTKVAEYPRSISIGIALFHPIVNQLLQRPDRAVAASYRSHCYDVINTRLDQTISRLASVLQREGHRAFPVPASKRVDDDRICAIFSHKWMSVVGIAVNVWIFVRSILSRDNHSKQRSREQLVSMPANVIDTFSK